MQNQLIRKSSLKEQKKYIGDRYDYSKANYVNSRSLVSIICQRHGEFMQMASSHLNGSNCPMCSKEIKLRNIQREEYFSKEEIIDRLHSIFGNKYEICDFNADSSESKVTLICPKHGKFTKKLRYLFRRIWMP